MDVLFGAVIALVTEGANSPFYVFFAFAVLVAAFRAGLRLALLVTATSALLYLGLILVSHPWGLTFYIMRPAYIVITGYLVGYLGEQRLVLEAKLRASRGGDTARAHRALAARRDRAGPRGRERAARDVPPAPARGRAGRRRCAS